MLGEMRVAKTRTAFERTDVGVIVTDGAWGAYERSIAEALAGRKTPVIVVLNKCDLAEPPAETLAALAEAHALPTARILLMPEGRVTATLRARMAWLADACLAHGYGLSDRLHIHLSGDTRGT